MARLSWLSASTLLLVALGCGGDDLTLPEDVGAPASIMALRGDDQEAPAGTPLPDSLVVKVVDSAGKPVPGQQVIFVLADEAPGAEVTPDISVTDAEGTAAARWVLGGIGGQQGVVARVVAAETPAALEVRFTASAMVPPPGADVLVVVQQPSASATVGIELPQQPVVQIRDAAGSEVARSGVPVTAAVASGNGTLLGTTTRLTDVNGQAHFTNLLVNGTGGAHVLIFAAEGYASVTSAVINVEGGTTGGTGGGGTDSSGTGGGGTGGGGTGGGGTGGGGTGGGGGTDSTGGGTGGGGTGGGGGGGAGGQPPTAGNDSYNTIEGFDHTLSVSAEDGVLWNDRDPEGGQLTVSDASDPRNGTVGLQADGSFTYTPAENFFGEDQFSYRVSDPSGNSTTAMVRIHVAPVNDPPWFNISDGAISAAAGSGPQTVSGFARGIHSGAENETDQTVEFVVLSNSRPDLFAAQPQVRRDGPQSDTGRLTFTPAAGQTGTTEITLVLRDNGGTANGGKNTSLERTFQIRVE